MRYRVSIGPDGYYYPQIFTETQGWVFILDSEEVQTTKTIHLALSGNFANEALNILAEYFHHLDMVDWIGPIVSNGNFTSKLDRD